jgi:hypothetical protein
MHIRQAEEKPRKYPFASSGITSAVLEQLYYPNFIGYSLQIAPFCHNLASILASASFPIHTKIVKYLYK